MPGAPLLLHPLVMPRAEADAEAWRARPAVPGGQRPAGSGSPAERPEPEGTLPMPVGTTTGTKARRKRGEGQWALGYREPLNKNEESKKNDDGLNVRQRILDVYSKRGFDSIDPADLRGRFR